MRYQVICPNDNYRSRTGVCTFCEPESKTEKQAIARFKARIEKDSHLAEIATKEMVNGRLLLRTSEGTHAVSSRLITMADLFEIIEL